MNPFLLKGYIRPEYFCNRTNETKNIIDSIKNGQDVTVYAIRRMGKSALIHHVFYKVSKNFHCIYADIWGSSTYSDFSRELTNAILKSDSIGSRGISKRIMEFIQSLGASVSIGLDGTPSVELLHRERNPSFKTLDDIFSFLNQLEKPVILCIDEFQEIRNYTDNLPLEAKLRTLSQQYQNIRFIFSGSEFHLIDDMFNKYSSPFYQSTRIMNLDKIDTVEYHQFIADHFKKSNRNISHNIIDEILTITHRHTYYVQSVCNYIFSLEKNIESISDFEKCYYQLLIEKGVFYDELPKRLTSQQFMTVKAIASVSMVESPTSRKFLQKSRILNPSSMQRIIKSLSDQQFIISENGFLRLYDVFLEHYLKYVVKV